MAKHDRRKRSSQPRSSRTVSIQVPLPVLGVLNGVREAFHGLCIKTGMQVLEAMMEGDREDLCGPKGRHQAERPAWRGGSVASQVTLGGRQVAVPRLRVRRADGEAPLPSFQWAAATDPLDEHTLSAVAAGVSTRRYAGTLDPAPAEVEERGTSSSAVSRRFVALSAKRLRSFLSRGLGELDLRVVCKGPPRRRSSPAACSAIWSRAACRRTGRCCSSSTARRGCAGPSPMSSVPSGWCNGAKYTSCATCSAICPNGRCSRSAPKPGRDPLGDEGFDPAFRVDQRVGADPLGRRRGRQDSSRVTAGLDEPAHQVLVRLRPWRFFAEPVPELTRRAAREGPESVQAAHFGKMLVPNLGPHRVVGEDGPPRHVGVRTVPRTRHQAGDALHVRRTAGPVA